MFSCLTRDPHAVEYAKRVVQLTAVVFVSSFNGSPSRRNPSIRRRDPLHLVRKEGKQIESTMMGILYSTIRNQRIWLKMRSNFAWLDGIVQKRGTDEDRRDTVGIKGDWLTSLRKIWKCRRRG